MAIGVFDSGVGGLTVHHRLAERVPDADLVYPADQANAPYGGGPGEEIVDLPRAGCIRLFEAGCDVVVLACNTAASVALRRLQQTWLPGSRREPGRPGDRPGLGGAAPAAALAARVSARAGPAGERPGHRRADHRGGHRPALGARGRTARRQG